MCFGPPFSRRARTRSTRTVNPAYRSRCSNRRCSHADQTARTPLVFERLARSCQPLIAIEPRVASPTWNASGPLSTSSSTASKRLRLACSISATSAISTVTRLSRSGSPASGASGPRFHSTTAGTAGRSAFASGDNVERCPQRGGLAEPANQNTTAPAPSKPCRASDASACSEPCIRLTSAPAVHHDHVFAIVAGEGQRGPVGASGLAEQFPGFKRHAPRSGQSVPPRSLGLPQSAPRGRGAYPRFVPPPLPPRGSSSEY